MKRKNAKAGKVHQRRSKTRILSQSIQALIFLIAVILLIVILKWDNNVPNEKEHREFDDEKENMMEASEDFLLLVNRENPLPADYTVQLKKVQNQHQVDDRIAGYVTDMIDNARKDGVELLICSSYRSVSRQQELFNQEVDKYIAAGRSNNEAIAEAAFGVAVPGHSEHNTGLALDIVTPAYQRLDSGFEETEAFGWLAKNAHKYGFILRYPKNKTHITKIKYEPWHYRFVGVEHARIIKDNGLTLEEYLDDRSNKGKN